MAIIVNKNQDIQNPASYVSKRRVSIRISLSKADFRIKKNKNPRTAPTNNITERIRADIFRNAGMSIAIAITKAAIISLLGGAQSPDVREPLEESIRIAVPVTIFIPERVTFDGYLVQETVTNGRKKQQTSAMIMLREAMRCVLRIALLLDYLDSDILAYENYEIRANSNRYNTEISIIIVKLAHQIARPTFLCPFNNNHHDANALSTPVTGIQLGTKGI